MRGGDRWHLDIFSDDDKGKMKSFSGETAGDVFQGGGEGSWELLGVEER